MSIQIKNSIKKKFGVKIIVLISRVLKNKVGFIKKLFLIRAFFIDLKNYKLLKENHDFSLTTKDLKPMIYEKTDETLVDPIYFFQDAWCAKKIFENKPKHHVDVGSETGFVGIISQFVPTTMVDIRPVNLSMPGFSFRDGNITSLPYKDNELPSISSICVIEHIGLGRFGDNLDQFGSEKAIKELKRVLALQGNLYISVPIDADKSKIYFNAHRSFTREHILKLFKPLQLIEEKYIYKNVFSDIYDQNKSHGVGLFHFKKL